MNYNQLMSWQERVLESVFIGSDFNVGLIVGSPGWTSDQVQQISNWNCTGIGQTLH